MWAQQRPVCPAPHSPQAGIGGGDCGAARGSQLEAESQGSAFWPRSLLSVHGAQHSEEGGFGRTELWAGRFLLPVVGRGRVWSGSRCVSAELACCTAGLPGPCCSVRGPGRVARGLCMQCEVYKRAASPFRFWQWQDSLHWAEMADA